jgi:hypothetical protein
MNRWAGTISKYSRGKAVVPFALIREKYFQGQRQVWIFKPHVVLLHEILLNGNGTGLPFNSLACGGLLRDSSDLEPLLVAFATMRSANSHALQML